MPDAVDRVLAQWEQERPDVDVSPMAVIGRISRAAAILDRHIAATLMRYKLLPGEFDLLAALRRAGAPHRMTVGDVLASTMVSSGAITNRLNRLVDKGFVTRETDPANRRSVIVTLSRQGLSVVNDALVSHVENERDLLASLDRDEQQHLSDLLRERGWRAALAALRRDVGDSSRRVERPPGPMELSSSTIARRPRCPTGTLD